jgi:DNA-binding MarR family transcriptional regulator
MKNQGSETTPLTLHQPIGAFRVSQTPQCEGAMLDQDKPEIFEGSMAVGMKDAIFRTFGWLARQPGGCLTVRQVATVLELSRMGEVDFGTTADRIGVSRSALSRIVERLVDSGLVVRREKPTDRRRILLSITAQGAELAEGILLGRQEEENLALRTPEMDSLGAIEEARLESGPLLLSGTLSFSTPPTSLGGGRRRHRAR